MDNDTNENQLSDLVRSLGRKETATRWNAGDISVDNIEEAKETQETKRKSTNQPTLEKFLTFGAKKDKPEELLTPESQMETKKLGNRKSNTILRHSTNFVEPESPRNARRNVRIDLNSSQEFYFEKHLEDEVKNERKRIRQYHKEHGTPEKPRKVVKIKRRVKKEETKSEKKEEAKELPGGTRVASSSRRRGNNAVTLKRK